MINTTARDKYHMLFQEPGCSLQAIFGDFEHYCIPLLIYLIVRPIANSTFALAVV